LRGWRTPSACATPPAGSGPPCYRPRAVPRGCCPPPARRRSQHCHCPLLAPRGCSHPLPHTPRARPQTGRRRRARCGSCLQPPSSRQVPGAATQYGKVRLRHTPVPRSIRQVSATGGACVPDGDTLRPTLLCSAHSPSSPAATVLMCASAPVHGSTAKATAPSPPSAYSLRPSALGTRKLPAPSCSTAAPAGVHAPVSGSMSKAWIAAPPMYSRGAVAVVVAIASLLRRRRALVVRPNERTQARRLVAAYAAVRPCVRRAWRRARIPR
jgi:hypothetical protein